MSRGQIIKGKSGIAYYEYTSWCHRYKVLEPNGKVKYLKMKGFATEEEAIDSYKQKQSEFENAQRDFYASVNKNIMFKDYIIYWFKNILSPRVKPNTIIIGNYVLERLIIPNIEYDVKINLVTTGYLDEITEKAFNLTPSGGYTARTYLSIAMKDAFIGGYINYNPATDMKFYHRPKPKIRVLSEEQMKRFLREAKHSNWYLEILLGLFMGMRKGEILGLKFSDFNVENACVTIERQLARELEDAEKRNYVIVERDPKTTNSIRCLKVMDIVFEELENRRNLISKNKALYGDKYNDKDYISCRENGCCHSLSSMNEAITNICSRLSLPHITVHGLRHMCATILLEEGVSLAVISAFLGHKSIHTTFEYYCEVMDEKDRILGFMNNLFVVEEGV